MYLIEHHDQIVAAFELVLSTLNKLCRHIHNDLTKLPAVVDNGEGAFVDDRDRIAFSLKHFEPVNTLSPQETWACPGAVGPALGGTRLAPKARPSHVDAPRPGPAEPDCGRLRR